MATATNLLVRPALLEEKPAVEAFAKQFPAIRDFLYTWERWGNWDAGTRNRPVIALLDGRVVALHAATFARRGPYLNSYFLASDPEMRGQGLAGNVVSRSMQDAHRHRLSRLKMKCHFDSPGRAFWEGFGCRPFAEDDVQLWYDHDIRGASNASELPAWMSRWQDHEPIPLTAVQAAAKAGARIRIGAEGYAFG